MCVTILACLHYATSIDDTLHKIFPSNHDTLFVFWILRNLSILFKPVKCTNGRSEWPRGLRRGFVAARLLGLWFRIPPGSWKSVCSECRVLSGRGLCDELITRPEESYRLQCVVVCVLETSWMRRPWPSGGLLSKKKMKKKKKKKKKRRRRKYLCYDITLNFLHVSIRNWPSSGNQTKTKRHEKKLATFTHSWPFDSFTRCQLCVKVANLVLCDIAFVSFPDNGPLRIETCRNIQRGIII